MRDGGGVFEGRQRFTNGQEVVQVSVAVAAAGAAKKKWRRGGEGNGRIGVRRDLVPGTAVVVVL